MFNPKWRKEWRKCRRVNCKQGFQFFTCSDTDYFRVHRCRRCERETDLPGLSALSALKSWAGAHKGPTQLQDHRSWEWGLYVFPQETSQMLYYVTSHSDRGVRSQPSSRFFLQPSSIHHGKPFLHIEQICTDLGSKVVLFLWSSWVIPALNPFLHRQHWGSCSREVFKHLSISIMFWNDSVWKLHRYIIS